METAEFFATVCVAEHPLALSTPSPEAALSTEHMLSLVHLSGGSAEGRDKYPCSARCLCNRIQTSSYFSPRLALQGTAVLTRFLLFLPRKKEMTASYLFSSHRETICAICETAPVSWKKGLWPRQFGLLGLSPTSPGRVGGASYSCILCQATSHLPSPPGRTLQ